MAPEVVKNDGYVSKSDIWYNHEDFDERVDVLFRSVGCLLYEMCTYQRAFDGKGLMEGIYKVVEGKSPRLPKLYSKSLDDLLIK